MRDCENCKHIGCYTTGMDEYPACTTLAYCKKGHWDNDPQPEPDELDIDCADFEPKISATITVDADCPPETKKALVDMIEIANKNL